MRAMASLWDLWSVATAERNKSHSLASARPRKIWKAFGEAKRLSSLERKKRAVLTTSALADTLPTEGFYD